MTTENWNFGRSIIPTGDDSPVIRRNWQYLIVTLDLLEDAISRFPEDLTTNNLLVSEGTSRKFDALPISEQRFVGRITGNDIAGLTAAEARTLIGSSSAYWNANKLQGNLVESASPDDGDVLTWNNGDSRWEGQPPAADAAGITYTPADESDWNAGDPGDVNDALDELADNLSNLLPPAAPDLDDLGWDSATGVTGKITWDVSNPITGYNVWTGHSVDETFTASGDVKGIYDAGSVTFEGKLNDDVAAHDYSYDQYAFGQATSGTLQLFINGVKLAAVDCDLTSTDDAIDTRNGNGTGFVVSARSYCQFAGGGNFTPRTYRTGTWYVNEADLDNGYNTIQVKHDIGGEVGDRETNTFELIRDADDTATSYSGESFDNLAMSGSKHISGVEYHTGGTIDYNVTISNQYRNTYSASASAINYRPSSGLLDDPASEALAASEGDEAAQTVIASKTMTFSSPQKRILDGSVLMDIQCLRTVQGTNDSAGASQSGILLDNVAAASTALSEVFKDENYRIQNDEDFDDDSLAATWDETESLVGADAGHNTGAQFHGGYLKYPTKDFSAIANGPAGNPDYSGAAGTRYFFRSYSDASGASNFRLTISGSATLVNEGSLSADTDEVSIAIRLPTGDAEGTGWMDINQDYAPGQYGSVLEGATAAATVGCYAETYGNDKTIPTSNLGITVGEKTTGDSNGRMYVRVSVPDGWTGNIYRLDVEWGVS